MTNGARFLEGYLSAWRSNDHGEITALFAPDAVYRGAAHDPAPAVGHDAILALWDDERDEPGTWTYDGGVEWETADGAIIRGVTTYSSGEKSGTYDNLWVVRFDAEGRATAFQDWWVERRD